MNLLTPRFLACMLVVQHTTHRTYRSVRWVAYRRWWFRLVGGRLGELFELINPIVDIRDGHAAEPLEGELEQRPAVSMQQLAPDRVGDELGHDDVDKRLRVLVLDLLDQPDDRS